MLHPKLGRLLNLVYYHAVFFGLMGTTLEIRSYGKRVRLEKTTSLVFYNTESSATWCTIICWLATIWQLCW